MSDTRLHEPSRPPIRLAARLPGLAAVSGPPQSLAGLEARHWIPAEQPEAMRAAIETWIARRFPNTGTAHL